MIHILTVCTGNVCRSPLAAQLLAAHLEPSNFRVESAGISPLIGDRIPPETQRIAKRMGFHDVSDYRARILTADMVEQSDLILGMSRKHRALAVKLHPPAVRRAFTLREFANIGSHLTDPALQEASHGTVTRKDFALEAAMRMRGAVPRLHPGQQYDTEDPYGRSNQAYERSAREINEAVRQIARYFDRIFQEHAVAHAERLHQP